MFYKEFNDAGIPFFGLYGINADGSCECMNPDCKAILKHPSSSNWQNTPIWDDDQIECMELTGQLDTGYGVLCDGLIVIDVDARNGGIESYEKLVKNIPEVMQCEFIVETGSGGGSKHLFFKAPKGINLKSHLDDYKGIDFKINGYCVGAGSLHKSGNRYKAVVGSPDDITEAPDALIELLRAKDIIKSGCTDEVSDLEISEMLKFIDPDCSHDEWIKIGMSIHHATSGNGFELWNNWSARGKKYPNNDILLNRWHSFGKSPNPSTIGTLIYIAEQNGYVHQIGAVEFESNIDWGEVEEPKKATYNFDPHNPPGLVGRITKWINNRSMYPRENLAVASALLAVSSAGGMRYRGVNNIAGNLFIFCVAGSGTGKENILQSYTKLMREVGIVGAVHGAIKSEQEIARNIVQHQGAFYALDEFGELLSKIQGARKKSGSASYLEGIVGALMSIYSKSTGIYLINNDLRRSVQKELQMEANALNKAIEENEDKTGMKSVRLESLKKQLENIETGIIEPYLNILGFTAPSRFMGLLDEDLADNGFIARALIVRELDDNPKYRLNHFDDDEEFKIISNALTNLYYAGHSSSGRVERLGDIVTLHPSKKTNMLLSTIRDYFWELGETQKERQGFVAYTRRGFEEVSRIALVLSMGESEISENAVLWAFEFVKSDMMNKINLTNANISTDKGDALISKITSHLDTKHGVSKAVLANKLRGYKIDVLEKALEWMLGKNMIVSIEEKPVRGKATIKYYLI